MRKIISKKVEERKRKRNQLIVGGILIFIMLFSVIGYSFSGMKGDKEEKITYNGIDFVKEQGLWSANFQEFQFYFTYNPEEIEMTNSILDFLNKYSDEALYIYSENYEAEMEIYKNLFYANQIVQRVQNACLEECEENWVVKDCENNFIIIKEAEENKITQENNCVFIEGKREDLVKLSDEFIFKITGIAQ